MNETETSKAPFSAADIPLPPASFDFLVLSMKTQAEMQLGVLHFGDDKDRSEPDLRLARHTIDLLVMLQQKTKGNLSMEEQRLLDNSVTELRFRYISAANKPKQETTAPEANS